MEVETSILIRENLRNKYTWILLHFVKKWKGAGSLLLADERNFINTAL